MIRRQTWVILVLFIVLLAGTLFWQQTKLRNAPEEAVIPTSAPVIEETLFPIGQQAVHITLQRVEDGVTIELRKEQDAWALVQPKAEATDSATVDSAVSSLLSARIVAQPSGATDLAILGLQPPAYRILVRLDNGQQVTINVGKAAGAGTGYYVLSDARVVYIVNKFGLDSLIRMVDTPPVLPTPTPEPTLEPTLEATDVISATQTMTETITPVP